MDRDAVLRAFDEQVRRRPAPGPDGRVERGERVVRLIAPGWRGVVWSDLDAASAHAVIAAEVERFAAEDGEWEWKHYSFDRPADLPERLAAAGFVAEEPEALLVAEIGALDLDAAAPEGIEVRTATDGDGVDAVVRMHEEVFGEPHDDLGPALRRALAQSPPPALGVVAYAGREPVAAARVELADGAEFAGLWGGGTLPAFRRRGIFRALVAHRAAIAAARGYRYVQVDALPTSAPILRRLGFVELAVTTPFVHAASRGAPLLLLDVDGVLCPVEDNARPGGYRRPSPDYRAELYEHFETGETMQLWVSEENARRVERLRAAFDVVWATGWVHHANRVIGPLHGLPALPYVALTWSEDLRSTTGSWKLPAVAAYAGDDRPCVWIDDDLRPDVERWADDRPGPTLLLPVDHRIGLTDAAVERALRFAREPR